MPSLKPLRLSSLRGLNPAESGGDPMLKASGKAMLRHCESPANAPACTSISRNNARRKEPAIDPAESCIATPLIAVPVLASGPDDRAIAIWMRWLSRRPSLRDPEPIPHQKESHYAVA